MPTPRGSQHHHHQRESQQIVGSSPSGITTPFSVNQPIHISPATPSSLQRNHQNMNNSGMNNNSSSSYASDSNNNNHHGGKKSPGLLQHLHNLMSGTIENMDSSSSLNLPSVSPILKPQISPILNPAATSPLLRSISPSIPIKVPFSINDMLVEEDECGSHDTDDSDDLTYNEIQSINYPMGMKSGAYGYSSQYLCSPPNHHHIIHATPRILSPPRSPPPIIDSDRTDNSCNNNNTSNNSSNNSATSMHPPLPSFKSTSNQPFRLSGRNASLINKRGSQLNTVGHQRSSSLDVGSVMDHHQSFRNNHLPIHSNNSFIPNPTKNNSQMPETPNCILETSKLLRPNSSEKVTHHSPHSDYDYSTDDTSSPTSSTSSTPRSSASSSQKKRPNLRIDTKSNGKTIPLQPITTSSPKVSPRNEQITPQKNIINLEQVDAYIKNNSSQKNSSAKKTFPSVFKNDFDDDDYAMLADYPVRSRSVSPPSTRRSSFSFKKTPTNSEKSDNHQTPLTTTKDDDLDSNYTTPPNRKSFSNEDGEFSSEERYVTPPSSGDHKMEPQTEVKGYRIRGYVPTFQDLPSPMGSLMMKCQTPVVFKSKMHAETFSASYSHMKYYARRKKKYLMMAVEKESSIMEDEFNSLREDFIEGNNIMKRTKKLDEMSFSEMIHTEQFDKNPYSSEEETETVNPNQMFFLGKRTDEKIARFLWRKMIVSIEQLHTDLKAFIHELEEAAENHEPIMSDDWHVAEMKRLAHQIIEAEVSKLIQQVYMKELNDMLSQLRGRKEESIIESIQTSFIMKELKKLIFIYSRVNRIIAVYNRIPEKLKVLSIDGRKRSASEARTKGGIPRVNTPPVGLNQFSKLSFLESTLTKKSGSSSDLIRESTVTDKQNLKINKLLKKWAEESTTVITPRSDQSSISTPSDSVVTIDSTPQSPQDTLFCRICEKAIEVSNFTAHTQTCAKSHEMNMRRISCDQKFKQLLHEIRKRRREETFGELYSYIKESYHSKTKADLQHAIDHLKSLKEKLSLKDELKGYQSTETQTVISSIELAEEKIKTLHEYTEDFKKVSILDFTLIKPISKGAYGKVYLARKTSTPDIYAIKVIEKQYIFNHKNIAYLKNKDKILSERAVLQQLMRSNHDSKCIVNFYYSFAGKKYFFIVMEYCSGGSLDCLLEDQINKHQAAFDIDKVRKIVAEIVLALLELHAAKIVHRDLKPDNMLVDSMGRLKLTDFGLSEIGIMDREEKAVTSSKPRTPNPSSPPHPASFVTSPNASIESESDSDDMVQVPGTPDYIAPEILLGEEHSYAVDYWSLGCITYELLFGVPPFNADTVEDIFNNILSGSYEWPEELPEEFQTSGVEDFVKKLLDQNPKTRLGGEIIKEHPFLKPIDWDTLLQEQLFTPVGEPEDTSRFSPRKNNYPVTPTTSGVMSPFDGATSFNSDGSSLGSPSPVRPGPFSHNSLIMSPIGHSLTNFQQLSTSIDFSFSSSTQALKELNIKEYNEYLRKSLNNSARSSISTGSVKRSLNFSNM